MNKALQLLLLFVVFVYKIVIAQAPRTYTSSEILLQIKKLNIVGSVLYIAAHPDDENTQLIAYLANEKCLRTGYLSLTRGDGGQNLIGNEQGIELGVIRTQELLAARRIDGGEQFFTRAYDFGYSKSPKETFSKWNKDSLLSDMVWVIRNFRPDIIITRFATDGSGGHGHHTASAILAQEAFDAAADPKRFSEQLQYVGVWQTRRMFYNSAASFLNQNADVSGLIKLNVGGYNPLLGKSYGEIAAESRSMHKSQGMGTAAQRGEYFEYFKPLKGDTANLKDIFEGIDFSWNRVKGAEKIGKIITKIVKEYKVESPDKSTSGLLNLKIEISKINDKLTERKVINCQKLIEQTNSLYYELIVNESKYAIGDSIKSTMGIINRSHNKLTISASKAPKGSMPLFKNQAKQDSLYSVKNTEIYSYNKNLYNGTYWLNKGIKNNLFEISDQQLIGYDELYNLWTYNFVFDYAENKQFIVQPKPQYKWVDPEKGELYRPLVITPPVMINVEQKSIVFLDDKPKEVKVIVRAGRDNVNGYLSIDIPLGWQINTNNVGFNLSKKGEEQTILFYVNALNIYIPKQALGTNIKFTANIDGVKYSKGIKEIKYNHIPIQTLFPEAEIKLVKVSVNKKIKRLGYIAGAGDKVQACLAQLGYEITSITDDMLANQNLNDFEAIITGVRAYNINEKLMQHKQKLMNYVSNGGNLIVQYNTNNFVENCGPYPFTITRNRVTDEDAKVNFELPNHPVLNIPNKITSADFEGWIQERCIYTAGDVDTSNYQMPLSMADPDEKPNNGSLLIAKHGKGNFIYTGLAFFRELPAAVPGAYRLFVNMIELGK